MQSPECSNGCDGIFDIDIIAGDSQTVSISSKYIAGTAYTFAVQIEFGRPYIGKFTVRIGVDNEIGKDYFGNVDYSTELILEINPAIMSVLSD